MPGCATSTAPGPQGGSAHDASVHQAPRDARGSPRRGGDDPGRRGNPAPRERFRPSRRAGCQGRPPRRHHGPVRVPLRVVRLAPLVAAVTIVAIGGWMLVTELRRWRARRAASRLEAAHDEAHRYGHDHPHEHGHAHAAAPGRAHDQDDGEHDHDLHEHGHAHAAAPGRAHDQDDHDNGEHEHGGVRHRHVPAAGATITWRSLFVLGLAGGDAVPVSSREPGLRRRSDARPGAGFSPPRRPRAASRRCGRGSRQGGRAPGPRRAASAPAPARSPAAPARSPAPGGARPA